MPVIDASVLVEYLTSGEHADAARERILSEAHEIWAPHLVDAEVGHALRRAVLLGELEAAVAAEALWHLAELPLRRVSHEVLIRYAWTLRDSVSFYDALYVALAELLNQRLITFDARLARASGIQAEIEVVQAA